MCTICTYSGSKILMNREIGCLYTRLLSKTSELLSFTWPKMCVWRPKKNLKSNFTLHLIKVGKLKRFKKVSSDLKTILKTDLANLRFLSFEKGEACQSILIMLRGKIGLSKPEVKKIGWVLSFLFLEEFKIYLSWNIS